MIPTNLQQWIQHPEALSKNTLYESWTFVTRYPYFQSLHSLYLKNLYLLHDISFGVGLRKAILYVADRRRLFYLIEGERCILKPRKKDVVSEAEVLEEEPGLDRTLSLTDIFLATVSGEVSGQTSPGYSMDYTTYLLQESEEGPAPEQSETPRLRGYELIDGFIERSEGKTSIRLQPAANNGALPVEEEGGAYHEEDESDSCFIEALTRIYVKQCRYSKAFGIIKKLSLKYPKKNAYFADQTRFLRKLIINAKSK